MTRHLFVLPDDTAQPILKRIASAKSMLRRKMLLFSDPALIAATIDAHQRGVKVRVMRNPARRTDEAAALLALDAPKADRHEGRDERANHAQGKNDGDRRNHGH